MLRLKTVQYTCGAVLAAALACAAAAQTAGSDGRLMEGQQLRALGRFAEAKAVFVSLLQDARKNSPDNRLVAIVLDNLGIDEQDSGDYAEAETSSNNGLAAFHATVADDPVPIALKTHLAELYIAEGRPEHAETLIRPVVAALRSSALPDTLALALAYEDLAVSCIMQHRFQEPETLLRQSQGLVETELGPDHPRLASGLLTFAALLTAQHRYSEAVAPAERAWKILRTSPMGIPKQNLAAAFSVMGAVLYHAGREGDAEECARRSVELADASLGPKHPRLALYLANYAVILKHGDHKSRAKEIRKRADEIMAGYAAASGRSEEHT